MEHFLDQPKWPAEGATRTIRLSVKSIKNTGGVWKDSLAAWTEVNDSSEAFQMDVAHTTAESKGKRIMLIQESTQDTLTVEEDTDEKLKFHTRCGKNAAILNKGLTAQRIQMDLPNDGAVFTNRPLKDDEIFQIKIDGRSSKFKYAAGIGIITKPPEDIEILDEMYRSPFAWMYYDVCLYNNGKVATANIGKFNYDLKVGDTMGVMRSGTGTLHFFLNGEDQGPAMSNVSPNVYGVLDLRQNYYKASIV